ncbi:GAF domain-containing protein, partial [candidate division KSB1 bacterium]|nr:GAF domain-containing protein [candidate division KSB1 bacterium]
DRTFNYVWSVQAMSEGIYYQTHQQLFRFRPQPASDGTEKWQVDVWRPQGTFGYTMRIDQTLYVQQYDVGLMKMVNDSLVLMPGGEQFANDRINVLLPFPGKPGHVLVATFGRGLFLWDGSAFHPFSTDADALLETGTIYTGVVTPDSCFALGTMANGLVVINAAGKIKYHFTQSSGLISNTMSSLFVDKQRNLWVAMDGGMAVLEYDSPLTTFDVPGGTGPSDFCRHKGLLYLAANDGVYYLDQDTGQFKLVQGVLGVGQSFFFFEINDELFATINQGIYQIEGKRAILALPNDILSQPVLILCKLSLGNDLIVGGTNDGVVLLRYDARNPNRLSRIGPVLGTHEYIRTILEAEPGVIWLGTMDSGIMRLTFNADQLLDPKIERFEGHNLPIGGVCAYKVGERIVYFTKQGVYQFDPLQNKFSPDPFFDGIELGPNPDEGIITADTQGNLWANFGKESAVYKKLPNGDYRLEKDQSARFADEVINTIFTEPNGVVWFGTANNVIRFAPDQHQTEQVDFPAIIRRVAVAGDSVVYYGAGTPDSRSKDPSKNSFSYRNNELRFDFSAASYLNPRANEFQTRLEGFDDDWSPWSKDTRRYYTNLPPGNYRFRARARNIFQHVSSEDLYSFTIEPPLYGTWWAWSLYILGAAGLVFCVVRARTHQLQERSRVLEKTVEERTAEIQAQKNNVERLSVIGRHITDNLSVKDIIDTAYENVNTLMDATVFGIGLFDPEQHVMIFPGTKEKNETLPEFTVPINDENRLAVWCFKNRKDVFINDYGRDFNRYIEQIQPALEGENPDSILYVPLQYKEKTIGVITAQSFQKNAYTEYHLNILRNLATYTAIALENADAYRRVHELLQDLKGTQEKLVTQSKLAALGALTAGIAHEIKNPLNFVNNFAELTSDLVDELRQEIEKYRNKLDPADLAAIDELLATMKQNTGKINEHGKRADSIVRSMLQHSRGKSGERQLTDVNALLEEDINLAYHGMRAQDSSFNITIQTALDPSIGKMNIVPQDISRVFLNIISNACYEAHRKKTEQQNNFSPTLAVTSKNMADQVEIRIRDNGNGIPTDARDKLFTPFFTTKPAGQGTGLGLSISYDIIVQEHQGELLFESVEGEYTEFIIRLPHSN